MRKNGKNSTFTLSEQELEVLFLSDGLLQNRFVFLYKISLCWYNGKWVLFILK